MLAAFSLLTACNGDAEQETPVKIVIPGDTDNDECCSLDDELAMQQLLAGYKEVKDLSGIGVGHYTLKIYAKRDELKVEHTELLFAVEKTETHQHVKDIEFSNLAPVMTMGAMNMKHSAPTADGFEKIGNLPIYRTWIAPLMASDSNSYWELSFNYTIKGAAGIAENLRFNVTSQSKDQTWLKSFKKDGRTYYLTIVGAEDLKTGINTLRAHVTRTEEDKTKPYLTAPETFIIDVVPTMPNMGDHSSPGNTSLQKTESGFYESQLNLTMTGLWNIHLVVKTTEGEIIAGGDNDSSGYSNLFWSVTI